MKTTTKQGASVTHYLRRSGEMKGAAGIVRWMEIEKITDDSTVAISYVPAMLDGWKAQRVTRLGSADWCGYSADSILAHRREMEPTIEVVTDRSVIEQFEASLAAKA